MKKITTLILIVLIIIMTAAITYLVTIGGLKKIFPFSTQQPPASNQTTVKEMTTYSTNYGLSFQYPKEWPTPATGKNFFDGGFPEQESIWNINIGSINLESCENDDCSTYRLAGFTKLDYQSSLQKLKNNNFITNLEETTQKNIKIITFIENGESAYLTALIFGPTQTLKLVNVRGEEKYFYQLLDTIKFNTPSTNLLRELLIKESLVSNLESYKIFEEIKSPYSEKTAVLFGLDAKKTADGCCSKPVGIFVNNNGSLENNYEILRGNLAHLFINNVQWKNDQMISYDSVISDEGGNHITPKSIQIK